MFGRQHGFTLIEMIMVIIIIGILAGVAAMKLTSSMESARYEATMAELDELARAIAGNAAVRTGDARADFGYVGDIGALPPDLDALVTNPGFATWDGPYISSHSGGDGFKKDAWNVDYVYVDTLLRSTGSGVNIDRVFAPRAAALVDNTVVGYIVDADDNAPGDTYNDSLVVVLTYPDGAGGTVAAAISPYPDGSYAFSGVPVGRHTLLVIYIPDADTATYRVDVNPGTDTYITACLPADLW